MRAQSLGQMLFKNDEKFIHNPVDKILGYLLFIRAHQLSTIKKYSLSLKKKRLNFWRKKKNHTWRGFPPFSNVLRLKIDKRSRGKPTLGDLALVPEKGVAPRFPPRAVTFLITEKNPLRDKGKRLLDGHGAIFTISNSGDKLTFYYEKWYLLQLMTSELLWVLWESE